MPTGSHNSLPFQVGGGPTRFESTYNSMQRMVGDNGHSTDDESLESLWRQAKSDALALFSTFDERAALQAFPDKATDHIPLYEVALGIPTDETLSDQDRRNQIVPEYTGTPEAWTVALQEHIDRIDPIAKILFRPWDSSGSCMISRWYGPMTGEFDSYDLLGSRKATSFPNTSDIHTVIVKYGIGNGIRPTPEHQRRTNRILDRLNKTCPSWVDFHVIYATGFFLDESLLDTTGFGI